MNSGIFLALAMPMLLWAPDRIVLQNGAVLEGEILVETQTLIEIRIGEGQVVGVSRQSAKEVVRDPKTVRVPVPVAAVTPPQALSLGEENFLVENREGKQVAHCRSSVRQADPSQEGAAPGFLLEEHWIFPEAEGLLRVSWIEQLGADLSPREILYREEGCGAGRVVLAKPEGSLLQVEVNGGHGKSRLSLPWSPNSRFPLGFRAESRERALRERGEWTHSVFDPRLLRFEIRRVAFGDRHELIWNGEERKPFYLRFEGEGADPWEEWVDPRLGTLRRECNGNELVARRATSEEIEAFSKGEFSRSPDRAIADSRGRVRLRLSDSSWKLDPSSEPDSFLLRGGESEKALLFFLDGPVSGEGPVAQLPLLEKKLGEGLESFRKREKETTRLLQGKKAVEIAFVFEENGEARRGLALLVEGTSSSLAVLYSFSFRETASVPAEWERLLARIELP